MEAHAERADEGGAVERGRAVPIALSVSHDGPRRLLFGDDAPVASAQVSSDGIIHGVTAGYARLLGRATAELVGTPIGALIHPDDLDDDEAARRLALAHPAVAGRLRKRLLRPDGGSTDAWCCWSVLFGANGDVAHLLETLMPTNAAHTRVSDSRREVAILAHVGRLTALGEMAAGFAHEINQPLAAILSHAEVCAQLVRGDAGIASVVNDALQMVIQQVERAGDIIRRIRRFARTRQPRRTTVNVNDLIREVVNLLAGDAWHAAVQVRLELDDTLPLISADSVQIQQVLVNLLRNAIEALATAPPDRRSIRIRSFASDDGGVCASVRDAGPGIPPDVEARLFQPFASTGPDGLGLGLAISRSIIEAHDGRIEFRRPADGGTEFAFRLPR